MDELKDILSRLDELEDLDDRVQTIEEKIEELDGAVEDLQKEVEMTDSTYDVGTLQDGIDDIKRELYYMRNELR